MIDDREYIDFISNVQKKKKNEPNSRAMPLEFGCSSKSLQSDAVMTVS